MSEHSLLRGLPDVLGGPREGVLVGIGDDAAVLARPREALVVSTDAVVEDVHFRLAWLSLADVGFRATMAALSDLAAMGARPLAVVAAVTWADPGDEARLRDLFRGQAEACEHAGVPLVGGNLTRGPCWAVATTVLGETDAPLLRRGARPGDVVWIAGALGLAAMGRELLDRGADAPASAITAFRRPTAQIAAGLAARGVATSAIDVSDGLVQDLGHVALASGVRVELDAAAVLATGGADLARHARGLELALGGGDDYALVVTAPRSAALDRTFRSIGVVMEGAPAVLVDGAHADVPGWDHGAPAWPR